eukprot:COSAG02_NODE_5_length_66751_cov_63.939148_33_plen_58_part_00
MTANAAEIDISISTGEMRPGCCLLLLCLIANQCPTVCAVGQNSQIEKKTKKLWIVSR